MKRIIAVLLCLALMIPCLAACGNKGEDTDSGDTNKISIKENLENGIVPELPLTLGCNVEDARGMLNALEALPEGAQPEEGYTYYSTKISGDTVRLSCEGNLYYYNNSKAASGISAMVSFTGAYGFATGIDMLSDITESISQNGTVYSPTANDLYFIFGEPDLEKYKAVYYTAGDIRVDFIIYDSYLSAVVIWNTALWNSKSAK